MNIFDNYWYVLFNDNTFSFWSFWVVVLGWSLYDIYASRHEEYRFLNTIISLIINFIAVLIMALAVNFYHTYEYNTAKEFCSTHEAQGYKMEAGKCYSLVNKDVKIEYNYHFEVNSSD